MKRNVPVQIAGQRFVLRSDASDDAVRELAAFVDARVHDIKQRTRTADTQSLAILTALEVAEELCAVRRAHAELKQQVRERGQRLLQFLERAARV